MGFSKSSYVAYDCPLNREAEKASVRSVFMRGLTIVLVGIQFVSVSYMEEGPCPILEARTLYRLNYYHAGQMLCVAAPIMPNARRLSRTCSTAVHHITASTSVRPCHRRVSTPTKCRRSQTFPSPRPARAPARGSRPVRGHVHGSQIWALLVGRRAATDLERRERLVLDVDFIEELFRALEGGDLW